VQLQNINIILIMAPRLVAGLPLSHRKHYAPMFTSVQLQKNEMPWSQTFCDNCN